MFFLSAVFLRKKAPGRAAPNRRPGWGCTKTPISIKIIKKQQKPNNQHPVNHENYPLNLSLQYVSPRA